MSNQIDISRHYWVSQTFGLISRSKNELPEEYSKYDFKYIGHSTDYWWPKKMHTGRLFHKNKNPKKRKKYTKNQKRFGIITS